MMSSVTRSFWSKRVLRPAALGASLMLLLASGSAWATGLFNLPHFVSDGDFALGFEPELTLTSGAGLAANVRYTQGLTELNNASVIVGTGDGPRRFRFGGNFTFDFFPDVETQPGIGLGLQAVYYRLPVGGQLEMLAVPYIHKLFSNTKADVEPFFSIPVGMAFSGGRYKAITSAVVGTQFKSTEKVSYILELGIAINNAESYFSGGIAYYH